MMRNRVDGAFYGAPGIETRCCGHGPGTVRMHVVESVSPAGAS
jgi:hypothetical protein